MESLGGRKQRGHVIRTIAGVIAGYVFFGAASVTLFVITGRQAHDPAPLDFAAIATVYGMVAAFLGGLIASSIAGRADMRASLITAALIALGAVASMLTIPAGGDRWSMIAAAVVMAPSAIAGGYFYHKLRRLLRSHRV